MADQDWEKLEPESAYTKKCRMTWAELIKAVYKVYRATPAGGDRENFTALRFMERRAASTASSRKS
jgi:hypothetical protein